MPVFEIYNPDGTLQISLSSRLTKYLGVVTLTGSSSITVTNDKLKQGTPWFYICVSVNNNARGYVNPTVSFGTESISCSVQARADSVINVVYGIYSNGSN